MNVTNRTDHTLVLSKLGVVVEPGETAEVPDDVGSQLVAQGWSPAAKKPKGKVEAVTEDDD